MRTAQTTSSGAVDAGDVDIWVEHRGAGDEVLLLGGLTDPAASWQPQLDVPSDRSTLTALDNLGTGRTPLPPACEWDEPSRDRRAAVVDLPTSPR